MENKLNVMMLQRFNTAQRRTTPKRIPYRFRRHAREATLRREPVNFIEPQMHTQATRDRRDSFLFGPELLYGYSNIDPFTGYDMDPRGGAQTQADNDIWAQAYANVGRQTQPYRDALARARRRQNPYYDGTGEPDPWRVAGDEAAVARAEALARGAYQLQFDEGVEVPRLTHEQRWPRGYFRDGMGNLHNF